jgi:chemosensory pili system protein ChpA (sensor histidine kinase/response regulator)
VEAVAEEVEVAPAAEEEPGAEDAAETVSLDDYDEELLEIFVEEARDLIEELDETIADWNDEPDNLGHCDNLKRILHTYKGGARMAGLTAIGDLAHDLETQLEMVSGSADAALLSLVQDYQDRLIKGTDRAQDMLSGQSVTFSDLQAGVGGTEDETMTIDTAEVAEALEVAEELEEIAVEEPVVEEPEEVADSTTELVEEAIEVEAPVTAGEEILEYSEDIDEDLLEIFIDEAAELLEELDQSIADWQDAPDDASFVDSLKRTLHTLKGGARMSGMTGLGSLAHDLETYLETFSGPASQDLFEMMLDYQDKIITGVDQARALAAGDPLGAAAPEPAEEAPVAEEPASADVIELEQPAERATPEAPVAAPDGFLVEIEGDFEEDLVEIFLDEADEKLEAIEAAMLDWQDDPDNDEHRKSLERDVHTIKGGANMNGINALGTVAHDVETELQNYRGSFNDDIAALLNDFNDKMHVGLAQASGDGQGFCRTDRRAG